MVEAAAVAVGSCGTQGGLTSLVQKAEEQVLAGHPVQQHVCYARMKQGRGAELASTAVLLMERQEGRASIVH